MKLNHKQITYYSVAGLLILIILSLVMTYFLPFHDPVSVAFKRTYPGAIIGSRILSVNDLDQAETVGAKFGISKNQAIEKFLNDQKSEDLVNKLNIRIPRNSETNEARYLTIGSEAEYNSLLRSHYGNSERVFNKLAVRPAVVDAHLRMKYYSDIKETNPAYKQAQAVLERYAKGEKFEDLAKIESDDKASAQIGGDLGFYESGQLIPELEDQVSISALGEVRRDIIVTRLGYHIVYPVEQSTSDGKKLWHVKHMLFVPEGYEAWLSNQTKNINVKRLLNS